MFLSILLLLPFNTGPFNWHCHILSHEDHEMMRVFHVGPMPARLPIHKPSENERIVDDCSIMTAEGCQQESAMMSISSVMGSALTVKSILMMTMMKAGVAAAIVVMEW
jgi:hypothetical protein